MHWILAVTKVNQEALAANNLKRQGYEPYWPRCKEIKLTKTFIRPLFPRYMFVGVDQYWHSIRGTRGVSHIVTNGDGPQQVPDRIIKELKSREHHGLVNLESPERFGKGTPVKATEGPLVGLPLWYDGMSARERCFVLLDILGRKSRVELEERIIVAA